MAGTTVDTGHGCTVAFGTSSFTSSVTRIGIPEVSRAAFNSSHMGTAATTSGGIASMTYIFDALVDGGTMELDLHFDPDQVPPVDLAAETITITWPLVSGDSTAANWAFSGGCTNFTADAPYDDMMTGTLTVKVSGKITFTAAA